MAHIGEELKAVGAYVELKLIAFVAKLYVGLFSGEHRVDQCFIEVHDQELLFGV